MGLIFSVSSIANCEQLNARIICQPIFNGDYVKCAIQNRGDDLIIVEGFTINRGNIKEGDNVLKSLLTKETTLKFGDECELFTATDETARKIIEIEVNTNKGVYNFPIQFN